MERPSRTRRRARDVRVPDNKRVGKGEECMPYIVKERDPEVYSNLLDLSYLYVSCSENIGFPV
jgi:hypothetical protein